MESNPAEHFPGADGEANPMLAGVATMNASLAPDSVQPSTLVDASSTAGVDPLPIATASLPAGLMQMDSAAPDLSCAMASDGAPFCGQTEPLRPLASADKLAVSEKGPGSVLNELLPPARLVEVAHAALQSSGFRRRPGTGAPQPQQQDAQHAQSTAAAATAEVGRSASAKRDLRVDGGCDSDRPADTKRARTGASGEGAPQHAMAEPPAADIVPDAIAHIVHVSSLQPPLPAPVPALKPPLPPLPNVSVTSPFARPHHHPSRSSGSGAADAGLAAPVGGVAHMAANGPLRSAFSHTASLPLPTEWQPGCSVTTGRRSARSPAPKGSRNLSLMRATSAETNSGSVSRRGSGFGAIPSVLAAVENAAAAGLPAGGAAAAAAAPSAAAAEQDVEQGSAAAAAGGGQRGGGALESAASADLRRLAQLAEAAAMLEEQMVTKGGHRVAAAGAGGAAGQDGESAAVADDDGSSAAGAPARLGTDGPEPVPMLRHRAGSLTAGDLAAGLGGAVAADLLRPSASVPASGSSALRSMGSLPGQLPELHPGDATAAGSGRAVSGAAADGGERESSPGGDDDGMVGSRRRSHMDSDAASEGGSQDGHPEDDDDDGDGGEDGGDGSNDSAGGGSSAGGGARTLTERYRAALKASAKQRGRGQSVVKLDPDKPSRGSNRNGLCARIASITKERLQQVYHLNIEEAARELGIGMTKLKEHCRTLGIPRWPSRKLKSMDKLIESLNERAMTEPATKEVIADILAEIESFKRAIYENPCLEVEEDIKRLRQSNFKKEYQQRQVEQRMRGGVLLPDSKVGGGSGRTSSLGGGSQHLQGGGSSGGLSASLAAAAAAAAATSAASGLPGQGLAPGMLTQPVLPPALAANLGLAGQLAAGAAAVQGSAQLMQAQLAQLAQAQVHAQQLPGQMPLLAPGQLQQLLMAQQPGAFQQLMAQRALGGMPPQALLLPAMLPPQLQQPPQLTAKPMGALGTVGEAAPDAE